jgi:hypothetical protein
MTDARKDEIRKIVREEIRNASYACPPAEVKPLEVFLSTETKVIFGSAGLYFRRGPNAKDRYALRLSEAKKLRDFLQLHQL